MYVKASNFYETINPILIALQITGCSALSLHNSRIIIKKRDEAIGILIKCLFGIIIVFGLMEEKMVELNIFKVTTTIELVIIVLFITATLFVLNIYRFRILNAFKEIHEFDERMKERGLFKFLNIRYNKMKLFNLITVLVSFSFISLFMIFHVKIFWTYKVVDVGYWWKQALTLLGVLVSGGLEMLIFVICREIKVRFSILFQEMSKTEETEFLEEFRILYLDLSSVGKSFMKIVELLLLLKFTSLYVYNLNSWYCINIYKEITMDFEGYLLIVAWTMLSTLEIFIIIYSFDSTSAQSGNAWRQLAILYRKNERYYSKLVGLFSEFQEPEHYFRVCGLFHLNFKFVLQMIVSISANLIVLLQFHDVELKSRNLVDAANCTENMKLII